MEVVVDRAKLLRSDYTVFYQQLSTQTKWYQNTIHFTFEKCSKETTNIVVCSADLVNEVDLVLFNPNKLTINDMITSIQVEFGGTPIDGFTSKDIQTQINVSCAIWKRKQTHITDTFIPLTLAPFNSPNVTFPSTKYHDLVVKVAFSQMYIEIAQKHEPCLYGNTYHVPASYKGILHNKDFAMSIVQNQYTNYEKGRYYRIVFDHQISAIYFWGLDISMIKNVKLMLDDKAFYNGPVCRLLHKQQKYDIPGNVVMMSFSDSDITVQSGGTIDFRNYNKAILEIESSQEDFTLHMVGLNHRLMQFVSGLACLRCIM